MGNISKKALRGYLIRLLPIILGFAVIVYFAAPVIFQHKVIGPFDFLVNFYHPYKDLPWEKTPELYAQYTKPKNYLMSDVVGVVFPMKYYSIESLKQGVVPLWNPAILNGAPHLANTQSSVFNPFNIVFIIFGYLQGFNVFILLQIIAAFVGIYLFLKQLKLDSLLCLLGALSFAFSGYMIVWLPWGTIGYAYAMLPWALYLLKRKYWLSLIPLTIAAFSGHIQTAFIVTVLFYAYALFSKIPLRNILFHALGLFLLSAPQVLPTLQLLGQSGRSLVSGTDFYFGQSLLPQQLIATFAPDFFGNPVTRNWWGHNNYAETIMFSGTLFAVTGVIGLVHTAQMLLKKTPVHREFLFFILAGIVSILLAVQSPLLFLLYKLGIPLFSSSTFSRNLSVLIFASIVAGVLLLSEIRKGHVSKQTVIAGILTSLATIALIWACVLIILPHSGAISDAATAKRNLLLPTVLVFGYAVLFLFSVLRKSKKWYVPFLAILIVIQTLDLMRFSQKYTPFSPQEFFYPRTALGKFIGDQLHHKTFLNLVDANLANIVNGRTLGGSDPLFLKAYAELATSNKNGKPSVTDRTGVPVEKGPFHTRILNTLGAQYIIDKNRYFQNFWQDENPNRVFEKEFPRVWSDEIYQVYFNKAAASEFYTVPVNNVVTITEGLAVLSAVLDPSFNPQKKAVVTKQLKIDDSVSRVTDLITPLVQEAHYQKFSVQSSHSALFVNNQTFYPAWSVYIDGKKAPLLKTNYVLQGVQVPSGAHFVEFVYDDRFFIVGCTLWILGIIFLASRIMTIATPKKIIRSFMRTLS